MASISELHIGRGPSGDAIDQALAIAWVASDIAVDLFGMLFWGALAVLVAHLVG
jgi:hypothetical protein